MGVVEEIQEIKDVCGEKKLKVILETGALKSATNIKKAAILAMYAGADYIKTSTGFSTSGATFADVDLFAKHVAPHVKIKAAGGISSIADAEKFISQMHRKYVWKRKTGRYPTCSIVKLELELFVRLKNYRRKLV